MPTVSLRELNHANLAAVLALEVTPAQKAVYPRSNAETLAEGHYPADDDPVWIRAIYADEVPVGLLMTSEAPLQGEYFLWRLMVDAKYQSKGYALQAVRLLIERVAQSANGRTIITSHLAANAAAGRFFTGLGFAYTGDMLGESDRLMELHLSQ